MENNRVVDTMLNNLQL